MAESLAEHLVMSFVADLVRHILDITDAETYQRAMHIFLDDLHPWIEVDAPFDIKSPLFSKLELDVQNNIVSVNLAPAGLICFRAWCNRQGFKPSMSSA